ncbi:MAG TPA: response regulator, partial [Myxococcales bacterium]|nr:response regulator [Myxococcales bacterium]
MGKERILVADADSRSLRMIELALRKAGFAVDIAHDGEQALEKAPSAQLVVCDAALPGRDGLSLCRALRAQRPDLPFVMVSAERAPAARARAMEAGADDYLGKPVLLKELVQRVQLLLERRRLSQPGAPAALTGGVRDLGLLDLFQSLDNWRRSALVVCEAPGQTARVWVRDGQVIDAELGALEGEAAFWRLMTWESGEFRVEFAPFSREPRIEGGTQGVLMEAMRRVDELGRTAESLPMTARLAVDLEQLAAHLAELPDEVNGVLRNFDGKRTLREALDLSPVDDLSTLRVVERLMGDGILHAGAGSTKASTGPRPSLEKWLSVPPSRSAPPPPPLEDEALALAQEAAGAEEVVHAPPSLAPRIVHYPSMRGLRRERLRREAEQARATIRSGAPLRLHHVIELPPRGASEELGERRRLSAAAGDAARRFAPDAALSRISGLPPEEQVAHAIEPAAEVTPA